MRKKTKGWASEISTKDDPDLEDMELVHDEQSETIRDRDEDEKQNEVLEESGTDGAAISLLGRGL